MDLNAPVVCATDFSPHGEGALAWAAALARRDGSSVDLVHVAHHVSKVERVLVFDRAMLDGEQTSAATARLAHLASVAAQDFGISVRPHLLDGEPHEALVKYARDHDARMIVMGAGGAAAVERLMLGSVAERTVRSADRPVVLVPNRPEREAWKVWTKGTRAASSHAPRVLAGLGDGDDTPILHFTASLRRVAPCDVTFLHLYWPIGEYARLGLQGRRNLLEVDPEVVKNLEPALRSKIAGLPGQGSVKLDIRPGWGDRASNLLVAVEDCEADLLVVGAHERHGLARFMTGSIALRLAHQSRYVPIAVVPATSTATARAASIPRLHTVLAVTDFSNLGNAAVAHAYALVRAAGGVVELCHIHEHALPTPSYAYDSPDRGMSELEQSRMLAVLRELVPVAARGLGIATHTSVVDGGRAAEAIVQAAERLDVDAIVMASHGRGGLARTVLGSVAQEVVHRAHRPVYVVRGRENQSFNR